MCYFKKDNEPCWGVIELLDYDLNENEIVSCIGHLMCYEGGPYIEKWQVIPSDEFLSL